jgi:hypothetical protein
MKDLTATEIIKTLRHKPQSIAVYMTLTRTARATVCHVARYDNTFYLCQNFFAASSFQYQCIFYKAYNARQEALTNHIRTFTDPDAFHKALQAVMTAYKKGK